MFLKLFLNFMKRRVFLETTGKAAVLASLGLTFSCEDDPQPSLGDGIEIDLSTVPFSDLLEPNSWVLHPDLNVLLVNVDGEIRAFTSVCTHSRCSRNWVFGSTEATCTCHGSKFDQEGKVVQGPAGSDLEEFPVDQSGNTIIVG